MKKLLSVCILSFGIVVGCEKAKDDVRINNKVRMFIGGAEIFDPALIGNFANRSDIFKQELLPSYPIDSIVTFLNKDTAVFSTHPDATKYSIVRNGDQFLYYSSQHILYSKLQAKNFFSEIGKYRDEEIPMPTTSDFTSMTREVRVGYGDYKTQRFPVLLCFYSESDDTKGSHSSYSGSFFNEFNPSCISKMREYDTLAIQEIEIIAR